jgi:hypothetical protein
MALIAVATVRTTQVASADLSDTPCPPGSPGSGGLTWCVKVSPTATRTPIVATAGDSTSRALDPGMRLVAGRRTWRYLQVGQSGCSLLPLILPNHPDATNIAQEKQCVAHVPHLLAGVQRTYRPTVWILSDRFLLNPLVDDTGLVLRPGDPRRAAIIERTLRSTLGSLVSKGGQVVIVGTPPPGSPAECRPVSAEAKCTDPSDSLANKPTAELNGIYRRAAAAFPGKVAYVSISDILCPAGGHCPATIGGTLARFDQVHFTATFSRLLVPKLIARAERGGISFAATRTVSAQLAKPTAR